MSILDYLFRKLAVSYLGRNDLAHVQPDDLMPDSIGRGEGDEGVLSSATKEVMDRLTSQGFIRSSSVAANVKTSQNNGIKEAFQKEKLQVITDRDLAIKELNPSTDQKKPAPVEMTARATVQTDRINEARMKGYEGDACGDCGNFTLVRNGTCLKCNTCGATSGCS